MGLKEVLIALAVGTSACVPTSTAIVDNNPRLVDRAVNLTSFYSDLKKLSQFASRERDLGCWNESDFKTPYGNFQVIWSKTVKEHKSPFIGAQVRYNDPACYNPAAGIGLIIPGADGVLFVDAATRVNGTLGTYGSREANPMGIASQDRFGVGQDLANMVRHAASQL